MLWWRWSCTALTRLGDDVRLHGVEFGVQHLVLDYPLWSAHEPLVLD